MVDSLLWEQKVVGSSPAILTREIEMYLGLDKSRAAQQTYLIYDLARSTPLSYPGGCSSVWLERRTVNAKDESSSLFDRPT